MEQCNHQEADTLIMTHILHVLQYLSLHTGDADVVIKLLSNLSPPHHHYKSRSRNLDFIQYWKRNQNYLCQLHCLKLRRNTVESNVIMILFQAFFGSGSTPALKFKGNRYRFKTKDKVPTIPKNS